MGHDDFSDLPIGTMGPIEWTPKLEVGIASIDDQHREIVTLYNAIVALGEFADRSRLLDLLDQLMRSAGSHFEHEERLMSEADYPHAAAHCGEHQRLLEELGAQIDDWQDGHLSARQLALFMLRWLREHIAAADLPMAKALRLAP